MKENNKLNKSYKIYKLNKQKEKRIYKKLIVDMKRKRKNNIWP